MYAGRLRYRIEIQQRTTAQDATTGAVTDTWTTVDGCASVPAAIEPLSAREFIAAQAVQSEIVARIIIRYRTGMHSALRIIHKGKVYNPAGFLADKDSGVDYLTIPVSEGLRNG